MKIKFNCIGFRDRRTLSLRWKGSYIQRRFSFIRRTLNPQIKSLYGAPRGQAS